jgi:hypothetical protein
MQMRSVAMPQAVSGAPQETASQLKLFRCRLFQLIQNEGTWKKEAKSKS